jgi:hypothetical protein
MASKSMKQTNKDPLFEATDCIRPRVPYAGLSGAEEDYLLAPRLLGKPWEVQPATNPLQLEA